MVDIGVYSDRIGLDFELLLECVTACDEEVAKHAKSKPKRRGRRDGEEPVPAASNE